MSWVTVLASAAAEEKSPLFGRRPDATLVRDLSPVRRFMPFLSPRRNDSLVYFSQDLDVTRALTFVEEKSRARPPDRPVTFLHLLLRAFTVVLTERPRLNRFTAGGRVWQRDGVWITLSAKQRFDDDAPILTVKQRFDPSETLDETVERLHAALRAGRAGKRSAADAELGILLRLPAPLLQVAVRLARLADTLGLLPVRMIEADPMFASVFVANLGSVGLEAGYHHLWEYGSIPIFCVVGRIRAGASGGRRVTLKWTYDERVEDGLYCARSLERLRELLENPEKL